MTGISGHEADAGIEADRSDASVEEQKMAGTRKGDTTSITKKVYRFFLANTLRTFVLLIVGGILLRLSSAFTGQAEWAIPIPEPFDGYSFTTVHVFLTCYAIITIKMVEMVSEAGQDQSKTVTFIQQLASIQWVLAALGFVVQLMLVLIASAEAVIPGQAYFEVFALAFANIESVLFAIITQHVYRSTQKVNSQTLKRAFVGE